MGSTYPVLQTFVLGPLQRSAKVGAPGLVNFNTAVAYHFCPSLPAVFTHPGAPIADLRTSLISEVCIYLRDIMTYHANIFRCQESCKTKGYTYAGVQYGAECFCGNELPDQKFLAGAQSECNMRCPGNNGIKCGGGWRMNVYNVLC